MSSWLSGEVIGDLAAGMVVTIVLTVITSIVALAAGIFVGSVRVSGRRITRLIAAAYTEVFRNVPALIQIIFWAFAVPTTVPADLRSRLFFDNAVIDALESITGLAIPYYAVAACVALILNTSGHLAEIVRSGLGTVATEHIDGARTLGASPRAAFMSVALPNALRTSFPAVSSRLIHNMKNTALASFVAVPELFHETQASITRTFRATEFLLLAAVLYLVLAALFSLLLDRIDHRLHRGRPRQYA